MLNSRMYKENHSSILGSRFLSSTRLFCKLTDDDRAGGGGKTANRKAKIQAKNDKLNENRAKRIQKEAEEAAEGKSGSKPANGDDKDNAAPARQSHIHPSRMAQVNSRRRG